MTSNPLATRIADRLEWVKVIEGYGDDIASPHVVLVPAWTIPAGHRYQAGTARRMKAWQAVCVSNTSQGASYLAEKVCSLFDHVDVDGLAVSVSVSAPIRDHADRSEWCWSSTVLIHHYPKIVEEK